jgi:protein-S-isoprenylcysteine O-methyltransferase Ste14
MPVLALVLFVLWGLLVQGVRGLVQYRRTGDWGFRRDVGRAGSVSWWARVLPGVGGLATGVAAPIASLAGLAPVGALDMPALRVAGVTLAVAGILAMFGAQLAMGNSWRIGLDETERTGLVTGGPFRLVRNPIYTAMAVVGLGLALMVPNLVALAGLIAFLAGIELQVRLVEEPHLRRAHGADYARYAAVAGRFVPGVGRLGTDASSRIGPGLAAAGLGLALGALAAFFGTYWDDAWHTDRGRDSFFIPPHLTLYAGVALIGAVVGFWALARVWRRRHDGWPAAVRDGLRDPAVALALVGDVATLAAGGIDNWWHQAFGRDAVLWSPPHLLGIVGMLAVGAGILLATRDLGGTAGRALRAGAGALVLGACVIPVMEFESDVPQFAELWYLPVLTAGIALALLLVHAVDPSPWAAVAAAIVYTALRLAIFGALGLIGFTAAMVPPIIVPALVLDLSRRLGLPLPVRAVLLAGSVYLAYVPALSLATASRISPLDIAVGLPLACLAGLVATVLVSSRVRWRPRLTAAALLVLAALALFPMSASAHDPGQGSEVGHARLTAAHHGLRIAVSGRLEGNVECDHLRAGRLVARRGGGEVSAPLTLVGPCRVEGSITVSQSGRWFAYVETRDGIHPLEAWIPVVLGSQPAQVERTSSLYRPAELSGSRLETVSAALLYILDLGVLLVIAATFRWSVSRPRPD